ncbi:MAG: PAS-domain containing protein [Proteobacteria bacterium]|nr:PAS-domain containing protein [Pseudomonadota bacterium]
MEAYENLIKNVALFLFIGAIPSLCWAGGLFPAFSLPSFFLLLAGFFCILWFKSRTTSQLLRKLILSRGEAWALCEGDQIIDRSPSFPTDSIDALKLFLHPNALQSIDSALKALIEDNVPFQLKVHAAESNATYSLEGELLEGKIALWLKNITNIVHQERLQTEMLQKNETLLATLQATLDSLPALVWQRDEHQKINYCNLTYANAVQSTPQKIYEEGIELIQPRFAKVLARKALHTEECQVLESPAIANGNRQYFRILEIPNPRNPGGTIGIAYDITELNDVRSEIKRLISAHDEVLDHLSTAICVFDAEGNLQYHNQAYITLHNFNEDFLKTQPRLDEVLEELRNLRQLPEYADFPAYKKQRLQQLKEQVEPLEDLMHLPDERTLRIFSAPHPMGGLLFMFEDVTDYLALERKNKTFLEAYQATLDNLFEGVVVIRSDNRLKIFNPSFVRLWKLEDKDITPDQHLNTIIDKLKDLLDYEEEWETYKAQFIEKVTDRVPKTGQLRRKDGLVINFRYVPLPNGDHLLSYTDATDTFRIQHVLQEKNEALETADRLKSEFIASVSYELRAPLNTIVGFSEILSHEYFGNLNKRQIDYVNGVLDSSTELLHLVNDILDLASIEAGYLTLQPNRCNIPTLLKDVITLVSKRVETNRQYIALKYDKAVEEWLVDERRLKQAIFNLLSNAVKFTPAEGMITVEAIIEEDELKISIADTGVGITPEDQTHLFKRFERGKSGMQVGAGLGLSLVKNLIELHGGYILLSSELNKGTKITCCLPKIISPASSNVEKGSGHVVSST